MITPEKSRYSGWNFVEVGNYVSSINRVIRYQRRVEDDKREPIILKWGEEVERFRRKNNNLGIYTSVLRTNTNSVDGKKVGSLYFDLDAEDVDLAFQDLKRLHAYFKDFVSEDNMRIYFTGSKGFHFEIEAVCLGVDPSLDIAKIYRYIADEIVAELGLETVDFHVYDLRRLWRLPNSQHQTTGLYKVLLPEAALRSNVKRIKEYASQVRELATPEPYLETSANMWYKDFIGRYVEEEENRKAKMAETRLGLFKQHGSDIVRTHSKTKIEWAWKSCFKKLENSATIGENSKSTSRNIELSRQGFRMYLMYLEAKLDTDEVTNTLQEAGLEIGLEEGEVKATLRSAKRAAEKRREENPLTHIGVDNVSR